MQLVVSEETLEILINMVDLLARQDEGAMSTENHPKYTYTTENARAIQDVSCILNKHYDESLLFSLEETLLENNLALNVENKNNGDEYYLVELAK